ncbi:hypothetical protein KBD59_03335 [Candidatus Gracilibacteria bacterium]|nr:hypothetical protein [Candidatus Gracilibacteria bacterium]
MIEGRKFIDKVKEYFSFLIDEFDFSIIDEQIQGNVFYKLKYKNEKRELAISINYENIEDYFQVIAFKLQNGKMPDYDDKTKTLHLNKLTELLFPKVSKNEIEANNEYFSKFEAKDELHRKLLKSAKELRLLLKHL